MNRFFILIFFSILLCLGGCASLPSNIDTPKTFALENTTDTSLGKRYLDLFETHPDESGFLLLSNGLDALTARLVLAQKAEKSIDAQYYMIHHDMVGYLFLGQLLRAADRGVRIRLLIDDIDTEGRDDSLVVFSSHPNISIRIFNPFNRENSRLSEVLTRFGKVTRRMHNKSFTVDNQITVVGGRNIGNEYFDADPLLAFGDLDVAAIGPVVKDVSKSFDQYWNSSFAYPVEVLNPDILARDRLDQGREPLANYLNQKHVKDYLQSLLNSQLAARIRNDSVEFYWGEGRVLSDSPDKIESYDTANNHSLSSQFHPFFEKIDSELLIVSPYFVPGKNGVNFLSDLSKRGVRVRIMTNSLGSTDVGIVHAGYAKYRRPLLRAGVELYEINRNYLMAEEIERHQKESDSKVSLHAKSFILDRNQVFIGSLNLDPRSVKENTEIGILAESEDMANRMGDIFDKMAAEVAFRVEMETDDQGMELLSWHGMENGEKRIWGHDPHTSVWQRFGLYILSLFPIESQL